MFSPVFRAGLFQFVVISFTDGISDAEDFCRGPIFFYNIAVKILMFIVFSERLPHGLFLVFV